MNLQDAIHGRFDGECDPADMTYFYDSIRRSQHYIASRLRRRLHRYTIMLEIELGMIDLGGEA